MRPLRDSYWILDGQRPVRAESIEAQVRWLMDGGEAQRRVALDEIEGVTISTVFIGAVLPGGTDDRPNLFETMIEGSSAEHGSWQRFHRYASWEDAKTSHDTIVAFARSRIERGESMSPDAFGELTIFQAFLQVLRA